MVRPLRGASATADTLCGAAITTHTAVKMPRRMVLLKPVFFPEFMLFTKELYLHEVGAWPSPSRSHIILTLSRRSLYCLKIGSLYRSYSCSCISLRSENICHSCNYYCDLHSYLLLYTCLRCREILSLTATWFSRVYLIILFPFPLTTTLIALRPVVVTIQRVVYGLRHVVFEPRVICSRYLCRNSIRRRSWCLFPWN